MAPYTGLDSKTYDSTATVNPNPVVPDSTIQNTPYSGKSGFVNSNGVYTNPGIQSSPISADSLTTPIKPLSIPNAPIPAPVASGASVPPPQGTTVDANGNATVPPPAKDTSDSSQTQSWIKQQLASLGGLLGTKSDVTTKLQADNQLAQKTAQATTDYNSYVQAQKALNDKIQSIQASGGYSQSTKDEMVANLKRTEESNVSNMAIQAQASQGLLSAAQKTIQDKLDAQFKPITDQIDFLTKFSAVNNNDLTDSQSKAIDQKNEQLKTDSTIVRQASNDAHTRILGNADYGKVAPKLDQVLADWKNGKITAQEASSKMADATSKYLTVDEKYKLAQINSLNTKTDNLINNGTGGAYKPDVYQSFSSIPDSQKNTPQAQFGGLTKTGLFNAAQLYLSENGKIPSIGLGSSGNQTNKRDAIINLGGAIADSLGMTLPQISAMYKANSTSATQIVNRVAKIDAVSNSLANQFPRLAELADRVGSLGISEQDLTASKAQLAKKFNNVDANNYIELVNTVRADYSAMQAAVAGSRGAQYFSGTAEKAIPLGASADVYRGLQQTILLSAANAQKGTQDEANTLIGNIGNNSIGGNTGNPQTGSQTVTIKGNDYVVGQVYQDASGAKWVFDAKGNPTKQ